MFRTRGFIFRKTVVYTGMVYCVVHAILITVKHYTVPEDEPSGSKHVEHINN
jgi:hypothetical protein